MTYKINGTAILTPTRGSWAPRQPLGISGAGRPVYAGPREFKLEWELMPVSDFDVVRGEWEKVQATGTVVVELPDYFEGTYQFREFSGAFLTEPSIGPYFQENIQSVILVVRNING